MDENNKPEEYTVRDVLKMSGFVQSKHYQNLLAEIHEKVPKVENPEVVEVGSK